MMYLIFGNSGNRVIGFKRIAPGILDVGRSYDPNSCRKTFSLGAVAMINNRF